jgi:hypothetical protein
MYQLQRKANSTIKWSPSYRFAISKSATKRGETGVIFVQSFSSY